MASDQCVWQVLLLQQDQARTQVIHIGNSRNKAIKKRKRGDVMGVAVALIVGIIIGVFLILIAWGIINDKGDDSE